MPLPRLAMRALAVITLTCGGALLRLPANAGNLPEVPQTLSPVSGVAIKLPWGYMPPPGASSRKWWKGVDAAGNPVHFDAFNCSDSVNYFISGDPGKYEYHLWRVETMERLDDPLAWDALERSLNVGDVVEFVAHIVGRDGAKTNTLFHVHICAGPNGLMAGANNEPRFDWNNGTPAYTGRWALCTSREYYQALLQEDPLWDAAGYPRSYSVLIYHKPKA